MGSKDFNNVYVQYVCSWWYNASHELSSIDELKTYFSLPAYLSYYSSLSSVNLEYFVQMYI